MFKKLFLSILLVIAGSPSHSEVLRKSDLFECIYAMYDAIFLVDAAKNIGIKPSDETTLRFMNLTGSLMNPHLRTEPPFTDEDEVIVNRYVEENTELKSALYEGMLIGITRKQHLIDLMINDISDLVDGCTQ